MKLVLHVHNKIKATFLHFASLFSWNNGIIFLFLVVTIYMIHCIRWVYTLLLLSSLHYIFITYYLAFLSTLACGSSTLDFWFLLWM